MPGDGGVEPDLGLIEAEAVLAELEILFTRSVNRELEAKARALAGLKGYITNLRTCPDGTPVTPDFVIGAYHRLFKIEMGCISFAWRRGIGQGTRACRPAWPSGSCA